MSEQVFSCGVSRRKVTALWMEGTNAPFVTMMFSSCKLICVLLSCVRLVFMWKRFETYWPPLGSSIFCSLCKSGFPLFWVVQPTQNLLSQKKKKNQRKKVKNKPGAFEYRFGDRDINYHGNGFCSSEGNVKHQIGSKYSVFFKVCFLLGG